MTLLRRDHLLAVDAEVLRVFSGPRVTVRPQVISGPASPGQQVWIGRRPRSTSAPSQTTSWHGADDTTFGAMLSTCFSTGSLSQASFRPLGGSGSFRYGEQLADFAQRLDLVLAHAERDAQRRAEQVAEHRDRMSLRVFEQQRRAAGLQHAVADFGHLEARIDLDCDALQFTAALELRDEVPEIAVFHAGSVRDHGRSNGEQRNP